MSNLILFTDSYPYGSGETFLETEIQYLSNTFESIHIFPLFYGDKKTARKLPSGVTFSKPAIRFDVKKDKLNLLVSGIFNISPFGFSLKEFFVKKVYKKAKWLNNWMVSTLFVRILLKRKQFSLVKSQIQSNTILYFYWGDKYSGIVPFIAERYSNPLIARFHGSDLYEETKGGYIPFREVLLNNLNWTVFISQKGREYLMDKYSNIVSNNKLFRLGVDSYGVAQRSDDNILRIVSCSNVIPLKRIDLIIDALSQLNVLVEWTHFGDGVLLQEMKQKCTVLNDNVRYNFMGRVPNSEIINFYKHSSVDLFINVSLSEGIPVSIMEAISFGIPVFATDVGGTSEVVSDSFGVLLPENINAKQLAGEILNFSAESHHAISEKRINARKFWEENFNAHTNYSEFAEFLKEIIV